MIDNSAEGFLPAERSLATLAKAVQGCQGCDLYLTRRRPSSVRARRTPARCSPANNRVTARMWRSPLRRAGRRGPRSRVGGSGYRSCRRLRDQRGHALPVEGSTTRQAPDPPETRPARAAGVPAVARRRAPPGATDGAGVPRRDRGAGAPGPVVPRHPGSWPVRRVAAGSLRHGDRAPVIDAARARRRAGGSDAGVHRDLRKVAKVSRRAA